MKDQMKLPPSLCRVETSAETLQLTEVGGMFPPPMDLEDLRHRIENDASRRDKYREVGWISS